MTESSEPAEGEAPAATLTAKDLAAARRFIALFCDDTAFQTALTLRFCPTGEATFQLSGNVVRLLASDFYTSSASAENLNDIAPSLVLVAGLAAKLQGEASYAPLNFHLPPDFLPSPELLQKIMEAYYDFRRKEMDVPTDDASPDGQDPEGSNGS